MSPAPDTVTSRLGLDRVAHRKPPRAAVVYSCALLTVALAIVVVLGVTGSPWPAPGPFLVLAIPLALCVNRFILYPNEVGATAEAAVVFAAMVAFHETAPWLGPLLLALCYGLFDARHWAERSFVRMAFNAGDTALVTAVALVTFDVATDAWGTSWPALVGAAALAALPYAVAEFGSGVVLALALGGRPTDAVLLPRLLNAIALPLALVGALAGAAAIEIGWWAALLVLLPVPLVPELVVLGWRRRDGSGIIAFLIVVAMLTAVGLLLTDGRLDDLPTLALLVVLATLVRAENGLRTGVLVAPLAFVAVVASVATMPADVRLLTAAAVAVLASGVRAPHPWLPAVYAIVAAAGADAAFAVFVRSPVSSPGVVLPTLVTGAIFVVVALRSVPAVVWYIPFLSAVAGALALWHEIGDGGGTAFVVLSFLALFGASGWGSLPWPSRIIGARLSRVAVPRRRAILDATVVLVVLCLLGAVVDSDRAVAWLLGALVGGEAVLMMALSAVRQWRFVPRRRGLECTLVEVAALIGVVGLAGTVPEHWPVAAILIAGCSLLGYTVTRPFRRDVGVEAAAPKEVHSR